VNNDDIPLDKSGNPIEVGTYIVYGHALGRCAGLRFGKVLGIKRKPKPSYREFHSLDSQWSITVIGYDDDSLMRRDKACDRAGTLGFPDRILVIPKEWLTEEIRSALDSFVLKKGKPCE
jgi:hypothetical protein